MNQVTRKAAFAGSFYPGTEEEIRHLIAQVYETEKPRINFELANHQLIGGIVPHAGYIYSAWQAVHFYAILQKSNQSFDTFIIVNPNHSGSQSGMFNSSDAHWWETPLGRIETDHSFLKALGIQPNEAAHAQEHSGEVQLPMLQYFYDKPFKIVMITMNRQTVESATLLSEKIFQAQKETASKVLVIASSDFSHYESPERGSAKDQYVIDQILNMNVQGISEAVRKHDVSACGYGPIMTLIAYSRLETFHPHVSVLKRGHSGEVHPSATVVDYVSFLCYEP